MAAATASKEKWIGFDMDECLAQLGTLYFFLVGLPEKAKKEVVKELAASEQKGETWILRPSFRKLFPMLIDALKSEAITGIFLYSNNGSHEMVEFTRDLINAVAGYDIILGEMSAEKPVKREGRDLSKNLEFLQEYVSSDITRENLLFFDDTPDHSLAYQLGDNYIRVTPYNNQLPVKKLQEIFQKYLETDFGDYPIDYRYEEAGKTESKNISNRGKRTEEPRPVIVEMEESEYRDILVRFIGPIVSTKTSTRRRKTRRAARKIAAKSRRCRRRRQSHSPTL